MSRLTTDAFIKRAKIKHEDKYDYSKVKYRKSIIKVKIICFAHGLFKQTPNSHLRGRGCKLCGVESSKKNRTISKDNFIKRAKKAHGNLFDYSKIEYTNTESKITIICQKHGAFSQTPASHFRGHGCPSCSGEQTTKRQTMPEEEFIDRSNKIHNYYYDYSETKYIKSKVKVKILCKIHGVFLQNPRKHLSGFGCSLCKSSLGEKKIANFLLSKSILYHPQYSFADCRNKIKLRFDFYLSEFNMIIEYDGVQHFEPIEYFGGESALKYTQHNDAIKTRYCVKNNIKLIRIPYYDFDNIDEILYKQI